MSLDELARRSNTKLVHDPVELVLEVWESYDELDTFLAAVRASRDASLG